MGREDDFTCIRDKTVIALLSPSPPPGVVPRVMCGVEPKAEAAEGEEGERGEEEELVSRERLREE